MEKKFFKSKSFWMIVLVDAVLVVTVIFLMNYAQKLLKADVRLNLTEIVTQNKNVITSKLELELNNLELEAKQLTEAMMSISASDRPAQETIFREYIEKNGDTSLVWANSEGLAMAGTGEIFDISGRNYFRKGMQSIVNISERLISRINGDDIFVLCVPLVSKDKIIGTIQKQYTPQEVYSLCSVSLYSEQGATYIINQDGYIMVGAESSLYSKESDNYYRIIHKEDEQAALRLQLDIRENRAGFIETVMDGKQILFAYTPIEQIDDWYLISSISTNVVLPNGNIVVKMFYCVLLVVAMLSVFSTCFYQLQKRKQRISLEKVAFYDKVTGGISFTKFAVDMQIILNQFKERQFHIATFDIDNFKYINSFYGFEKGDHILKHIYQLTVDKLKENERIARVTGDNFVLLLEDVSEERLTELMVDVLYLEDMTIYLSYGIYPIMELEENVNLMMDKANTAAKKNKGIRYRHIEFYLEDFDKEIIMNEQLKRSVEIALLENEIIPFFQPKVDVNTRELAGAEALARWRTKDGRLIPPGAFLPVCEKSGLIKEVDRTIFEKTLQFISKNLKNGVDCKPISVNFSRLHLLDKEFLQNLLDKLNEYEVPPELIELELTETVIFDNHQTIDAFIEQLHDCGLKISMDDFGTGYSSLYLLKNVDIDILKIDRGFLMDSSDNERQSVIFGAIVQMAKKLNMKVVVEGVETLDNIALMQEFGCSIAQGYYFAKPMPEEEFAELYRDGKV